MLVYFRLCKAGYAKSIAEAKEMDVRTVKQALDYEDFCGKYERAFMELNR